MHLSGCIAEIIERFVFPFCVIGGPLLFWEVEFRHVPCCTGRGRGDEAQHRGHRGICLAAANASAAEGVLAVWGMRAAEQAEQPLLWQPAARGLAGEDNILSAALSVEEDVTEMFCRSINFCHATGLDNAAGCQSACHRHF